MAVRSTTGSSGCGPNSVVRNLEQKNSSGSMGNPPLMTASSQIGLSIDQYKNDESRNVENFGDGDFLTLTPNCDRQSHIYHMVTGHNAPQNSIPEILTGRTLTQNNPLPQQFTQTHNLATQILRGNTLPMVGQTHRRQNPDKQPHQQTCWRNRRLCIQKITSKCHQHYSSLQQRAP